MSRVCEICGKKPTVKITTSFLRAHYNPTGRKKQLPNLQKVTIDGKKVKACTNCVRKMYKSK